MTLIPTKPVWKNLSITLGFQIKHPFLERKLNFITVYTQTVKNLPAMQKTRVWPLGWEDALEKGMATHSSILAWRIPWTEELGRLQSMGVAKSQTRLTLTLSTKVTAIFFRNVCPVLKWNIEIRGLKRQQYFFFTLWQWIQRQRYPASAFVTAFWGWVQAPESPCIQI